MRRIGIAGRWLIFLLILSFLFAALYAALLPTLRANAEIEAHKLAERAIANAVNEAARESGFCFQEILRIERNAEGRITAIVADTGALNRWREALVETAEQKLVNGEYTAKIPLGTLLGSRLFYGRGPKISLRLSLGGYLSASFRSDLSGAGVNQTKYTLSALIDAKMFTYLPASRLTVETETEVLLAEAFISGEVPSFYTVPAAER